VVFQQQWYENVLCLVAGVRGFVTHERHVCERRDIVR
jgi:hypothetical protein